MSTFPFNKKKMVVAVEWDDAHGNTRDQLIEEAEANHKPLVYISVGLLLLSDDIGVSLCMDLCEDGGIRGACFIPRGMVKREWIIGPLHTPTKRSKKPTPIPSGTSEPSHQVE